MTTVKSVTNGNYTHTLTITTSSQNVAANTSLVAYTYSIHFNSGTPATQGGTNPFKATIDGVADTENHGFNFGTSATLTAVSGTKTITHNSDGTKSISASFDGPVGGFSTGFPETTGSGTYTLATIPRASVPTFKNSGGAVITSTDAGLTIEIDTNRADATFTQDITYAFGGASGTIATGVGASTTWTPDMTLLNQIPNSTSAVATITTVTKNSAGTVIGTTNVSLTITVPTSVVPTIISVTGTEATTTPNVASIVGGLVQGISTLAVAMSGAAGVYSSTIVSSSLSIDGQVISGSSGTTAVITDAGTLPLVATVVDSRGRSTSISVNKTVLPYTVPAISVFTVQRALTGGGLDPNGTYFSIGFTAAVQSLIVSSQKNDLHYSFKQQAKGGTTPWASVTPEFTTDAGAVSYTGTLLHGTYSIANSYDVRMEVTDALGIVSAVQGTVGTGGVLLHMSNVYDAIGVGMFTTKSDASIEAFKQIYQNNGNTVVDLSTTFVASDAEAIAGTLTNKLVTPHALAAASAAASNASATFTGVVVSTWTSGSPTVTLDSGQSVTGNVTALISPLAQDVMPGSAVVLEKVGSLYYLTRTYAAFPKFLPQIPIQLQNNWVLYSDNADRDATGQFGDANEGGAAVALVPGTNSALAGNPYLTCSSTGIVHLAGLLYNATAPSAGAVICNIGTAFAPTRMQLFRVYSNTATTGAVAVMPNGDVIFVAGSTGYLALDGVRFRTAAWVTANPSSYTALTLDTNVAINAAALFTGDTATTAAHTPGVTIDGDGVMVFEGSVTASAALAANANLGHLTTGPTATTGVSGDHSVCYTTSTATAISYGTPSGAGGGNGQYVTVSVAQASGAHLSLANLWAIPAPNTLTTTDWIKPFLKGSTTHYNTVWPDPMILRTREGMVFYRGLWAPTAATTIVMNFSNGWRPRYSTITAGIAANIVSRIDIGGPVSGTENTGDMYNSSGGSTTWSAFVGSYPAYY